MPKRARASTGEPSTVSGRVHPRTERTDEQRRHTADEGPGPDRLEDAHGPEPEEDDTRGNGVHERVAERLRQAGGLAQDRGHGGHVGREGRGERHHQETEDEPQQGSPPPTGQHPQAHQLDELERLSGAQEDLHEHEVDEARASVRQDEDDEESRQADLLGEVGHRHDAGPDPGTDHQEGGPEQGQRRTWHRVPGSHQRVAISTLTGRSSSPTAGPCPSKEPRKTSLR